MRKINKCTVILLAGSAFLAVSAKENKSSWDKSVDKQIANAPAQSALTESDLRATRNRTDIGRQEVIQRGDAWVKQANAAFQRGEFHEAVKLYIKAKQEFSKFSSPVFVRQISFCQRSIDSCYNEQAVRDMAEADRVASNNDFETAIKICKEAIKFCPERAEELEEKIAFFEKRKAAFDFEHSTSIDVLNPNKKDQDYQIQILLEQGRKLITQREYAKAIAKFNSVLLIDPYNDDANQNLLACYNRVTDQGNQRRYNTRYRLMSEAAWKFSSPVLPEVNQPTRNLLGTAGRLKDDSKVKSPLEEKLSKIVIKSLELPEMSIADAIATIRNQSVSNDPERQGINIVYLEPKQASGDAAAKPAANNADGEAAPAANDNAAEEEDAGKTIPQMNFSNRTLREVLEEICKAAKLSSPRIEHDIVVISHKEIPSVDLETKLFRTEIPNYRDPVTLQKQFEKEWNIPFPKGAELYYHPNICTLVVKNTRRNLDLIGAALEKYYTGSESTPMVQIRLKVIEISQNDLNELAFNWSYGVNTAKTSSTSEQDRLTSKTTQIAENNQLLRHYFDANNGSNDPIADQTLGFSWSNSDGTYFRASMYALNQADSADTLYSPQVTTLVGVPATVSMQTQRTFPEDWELIDYETSSEGNTQITSVTPFPNLDNVQNLGMNFSITPRLINSTSGEGSEGRKLIEINADFVKNPIKTFSGWYRYDARYAEDDSIDGEYYMMPIFNERQFKTLVTLYDGETVLLTGMAVDTNEIVHDKIPILGDIPFIGRFFQSRYTKATKSNLLVFATCRLVKADGTPLYPSSQSPHGEFDFGRNY